MHPPNEKFSHQMWLKKHITLDIRLMAAIHYTTLPRFLLQLAQGVDASCWKSTDSVCRFWSVEVYTVDITKIV